VIFACIPARPRSPPRAQEPASSGGVSDKDGAVVDDSSAMRARRVALRTGFRVVEAERAGAGPSPPARGPHRQRLHHAGHGRNFVVRSSATPLCRIPIIS
jgi:hypothetical protein